MAIDWDNIDLTNEYDEYIFDKVRTTDTLSDIIERVYSDDKADEYHNLLTDVLLEKQGALRKLDTFLMDVAEEVFTYKEFVKEKEEEYWSNVIDDLEHSRDLYD